MWQEAVPFVTTQLVESATYNRQAYPFVVSSATSLSSLLAEALSGMIRDSSADPVQKIMARQLLIDLLHEEPRQLAELILGADDEDVIRAMPTLDHHRNDVLAVFRDAVTIGYEDTLSQEEWVERARRQSMAAALLLHYRQTQDVWDVFRQSAQPDARTYLIHRVQPLDVDPAIFKSVFDGRGLKVIIVIAAAGNQQHTQRFFFFCLHDTGVAVTQHSNS